MKTEKTMILGAAFGVAVGSVIGVLTDSAVLWISLGIAFGALIGMFVDQNQKIDNNDKK